MSEKEGCDFGDVFMLVDGDVAKFGGRVGDDSSKVDAITDGEVAVGGDGGDDVGFGG